MIGSIAGLEHGFSIALQPRNLMWSFIGVTVGNLVGVLPGMGVLSTVAILLPLTFAMTPVAAVLMIAGIFYGATYGGAICAILLNLPCHAPHAVTCIDGHAMTRRGKGGVALGLSILGALFGAAFGIVEMMFLAPFIASIAFKFGAAEISSIMLLGLLTGSTLARGSPLKGFAMMLLGLLLGTVGTDVNTGVERFTFGLTNLADGVTLVSLSLGIFGVAEFLRSVNKVAPISAVHGNLRARDLWPSRSDLKQAIPPIFRGTIVGSMCSLVPGAGPTIASFAAYAVEKKLSKTPEKFGLGAIEGVAAPEAAAHSSVQGDFIPTLSLGIPGDSAMALLLGALIIHGITPGPRLIVENPDVFWGLIASFWIGNIMLVILNVPLVGLWVKLLMVPYKYLYPSALFFICIGVYADQNSIFDVMMTLVIGVFGYVLLMLQFEVTPILLGFVLGPRLEENFRRALLLSRGDLLTFVERPLSAVFIGLCALIIVLQVVLRIRDRKVRPRELVVDEPTRSLEREARG